MRTIVSVAACLFFFGVAGCAETMRRSVSVSYEGAALTYSWERDPGANTGGFTK